MYRTFYGLRKKAFELTPTSDVVYMSETHKEALATLRYGIISDKGFLVLTGGIGTGKSTLVNNLLAMVSKKVRVCVLNNPTLNRQEFLHYVAHQLGLEYKGNKADFILKFSQLLDKLHRRKEKVLLIIDEAQAFPIKLMEEVRLLSNQAGARNVLSIFLIGQPELQETLAHPRLQPLRQRIGIRFHLLELRKSDTAQYIAFRLLKAGAASPSLFTEAAIDSIHRASGGNPRLINIICDHALISGFAHGIKQVDRDLILECVDELKLPGETELIRSEHTEESKTKDSAKGRGGKKRSHVMLVLVAFLAFAIMLGVLSYGINQNWYWLHR